MEEWLYFERYRPSIIDDRLTIDSSLLRLLNVSKLNLTPSNPANIVWKHNWESLDKESSQ